MKNKTDNFQLFAEPVPFVFTEKERNDCINSLKQEHNLYELFEDIPNTGPKHCYKTFIKVDSFNLTALTFFYKF